MQRLLPTSVITVMTASGINTLTRSLTHALTATLIHTLSSPPLREYYCFYCYNWGYYCGELIAVKSC